MTNRPLGFRVSFLGVRLAVVSDVPAVAETMDRYVMPWLPREPIGDATADRLVRVREVAGGGLEIVLDGAVVAVAPSPLAAIPYVQRLLDDPAVRCQSQVAVVHAGVVAHNGRGILLPGSTGSGKSTLVAELVQSGASYLSDEYALIDVDGRVHPYPGPLLLRDESGQDLPPRLATELGGTVAREPVPASLIIGVRHAPHAAPGLHAMSQADGVLLLLRNTPHALVDQPWILAPLARAVEGAACYAGLRGAAREAAAEILQLAASAARDDAAASPCAAGASTPTGSTASP